MLTKLAAVLVTLVLNKKNETAFGDCLIWFAKSYCNSFAGISFIGLIFMFRRYNSPPSD